MGVQHLKASYGEEKSLRHFAMVANFWITTNQKRHLKSEFALIQTSSIFFSFIESVKMFAKFSDVECERTVCKLQKGRLVLDTP